MVWAPVVTVILAKTVSAAVRLSLPAWSAVNAQVPILTNVTTALLVPLVVHTVGVLLAKVTGLPLLPPVALRLRVLLGAMAKAREAGGLKPVMAWVPFVMSMSAVSVAAAR